MGRKSKPQLDRMAFRRESILLEDGTPFGKRMEPWQVADFEALDNGQYRHAYLERPRGHSKTGDIGTEACVELILGKPAQQLFCAAADEGQARLLFEDVAGKFQRHPALRPLVRVTQRDITVKATGSRLRVLASDAPTAYGLRPDWIAIDELAEWRRRDLWDSLWTATGKRPECRVIVISTAGWDRTSIGWEVRQIAEREADWYFSSRGQCASWISPAWLEQQRRTLPAHVFARLHESRWTEAGGAWLSAEQVEAIFGALPEGEGSRCIGLDIGISRDRTVIAAVKTIGGLAVVEHLQIYTPTKQDRVDLSIVEEDVRTLALRLGASIFLDPYQAVGIAQRLRERGINVREYPFTADKRRALFGKLLDYISTGRLRARPHEEFKGELLSLEVKESLSGWRVDHRSNAHDDIVVAVSLGLAGLTDGDTELKMWSAGEGLASRTAAEIERDTAEAYEAKKQASAEMVEHAVRTQGWYWPGGR